MWQDLGVAMCLVLVIEGLMPFLSPRAWRGMVEGASRLDDRTLRIAGLSSMLVGTALLYVVH